jgi:hypothetical protein
MQGDAKIRRIEGGLTFVAEEEEENEADAHSKMRINPMRLIESEP